MHYKRILSVYYLIVALLLKKQVYVIFLEFH